MLTHDAFRLPQRPHLPAGTFALPVSPWGLDEAAMPCTVSLRVDGAPARRYPCALVAVFGGRARVAEVLVGRRRVYLSSAQTAEAIRSGFVALRTETPALPSLPFREDRAPMQRTPPQRLHALMGAAGVRDHKAYASRLLGRPVASFAALSAADLDRLAEAVHAGATA